MMRCKNLLFLSLITAVAFCTAEKSRLIPVTYNPEADIWGLLMAKDRETGYWTDFSAEMTGTDYAAVAAQALKDQTNNVYTVPLTSDRTTMLRTDDGDSLYFVLVRYIPDAELNRRAQSIQKSAFEWVQFERFAEDGFLMLGADDSRSPVQPRLKEIINSTFPDKISQLKVLAGGLRDELARSDEAPAVASDPIRDYPLSSDSLPLMRTDSRPAVKRDVPYKRVIDASDYLPEEDEPIIIPEERDASVDPVATTVVAPTPHVAKASRMSIADYMAMHAATKHIVYRRIRRTNVYRTTAPTPVNSRPNISRKRCIPVKKCFKVKACQSLARQRRLRNRAAVLMVQKRKQMKRCCKRRRR